MITKPTKFMMAEDPKKSGGDDDGDKDEKLAAMIAAAVSKSVNAAVTERFRRESAKVEERFKALEAKKAGAGDDGEEADDDEPGAVVTSPKAAKGAPDPAFVAMQKRLERTEKLLADEKAARDKAVADGKVRDERSALQEALTAAGVRKEMLGPAVAYLYSEQKKLKRTEEDKIVFLGDDESELTVADGAKAWVKSDLGQQFMPPRNAGGSGGTGGKQQGGGGGGQPDASDRTVVDLLLGNSDPA